MDEFADLIEQSWTTWHDNLEDTERLLPSTSAEKSASEPACKEG